jgi:hypothetical protein
VLSSVVVCSSFDLNSSLRDSSGQSTRIEPIDAVFVPSVLVSPAQIDGCVTTNR